MSAFKLFDKDEDSIINLDDFSNGIRNILGLKLNQSEIHFFYSKIEQPFN